MAQKFHERFNIPVSADEARERFVNRVHNEIFGQFLHSSLETNVRNHAERIVLTILGIKRIDPYKTLESEIGNEFWRNVQAVEAFYNSVTPANQGQLARVIRHILSLSEVDLGIRWYDGHFLPSGAPLLDEKLVNDVLGCLGAPKYEGVRKPLQKGLEHFLQSVGKPQFLADVVTDMYEALEALAKIVTGRNKDLSSNAELFIAAVKASDGYKPLLKEYIAYANTIRHAGKEGKPKPPLSKKEVESFVYLTGLFIRFATMEDLQV